MTLGGFLFLGMIAQANGNVIDMMGSATSKAAMVEMISSRFNPAGVCVCVTACEMGDPMSTCMSSQCTAGPTRPRKLLCRRQPW